MQTLAIFVLLISTAFGLTTFERLETTTVRDIDNSVYSDNEEPSALPQFPENKPSTGCFSNIPATGQDVDQIKNIAIDSEPVTSPPAPLTDPIPPQFTPFNPPGPFQRRFPPSFAPPPFMPQPQPFNNFIPQPQPFNSFGPQPYGPRNFYPFNRPAMPFHPMPFSPFQRFSYPGNHNNGQQMVIFKLLQPIILPVARPMFPEGGETSPDEVDSERYSNGFRGNRKFGRFGAERLRVEKPLPYRGNTFGPYKVPGEENVHITVKLH